MSAVYDSSESRIRRVVVAALLFCSAASLLPGCSGKHHGSPVSPGYVRPDKVLEALDVFRTAADPACRWVDSPFTVGVREAASAIPALSDPQQHRGAETYRGGWHWQDVGSPPSPRAVIDQPGFFQCYPDCISGGGYTYTAWLESSTLPPNVILNQARLFRHRDDCPHVGDGSDGCAVSFFAPGDTFGPRVGLSDQYVTVALCSNDEVWVSRYEAPNLSVFEGTSNPPKENSAESVYVSEIYSVDIVGHSFSVSGEAVDVFYVVASVRGTLDHVTYGYAIVGWMLTKLDGDWTFAGPHWVSEPDPGANWPTKVAVEVDDSYCHVAWLAATSQPDTCALRMVSGALPASLAVGSLVPFDDSEICVWTQPYDVGQDAEYFYAMEYAGLRSFEIDADQRGNLAVAYLSPVVQVTPTHGGNSARSGPAREATLEGDPSYVTVRWFRDGSWTYPETLGTAQLLSQYPMRSLDMEYDSFNGTHLVATGWDPDNTNPQAWAWSRYARHNGTFWEIPEPVPPPPPYLSPSIWDPGDSEYYWQTSLAVTANYDCEMAIVGEALVGIQQYSTIYLARSRHLQNQLDSPDTENPPALSLSTGVVDIPPWDEDENDAPVYDPWEGLAGFGGTGYQLKVFRRHALGPHLAVDCLDRVNVVWSEYLDAEAIPDHLSFDQETVHFRRQFANGNQWSKPIWLNNPNRYDSGNIWPPATLTPRAACNPTVTTGADGLVYVAWQERIAFNGTDRWWIVVDGELYDDYFSDVPTPDPIGHDDYPNTPDFPSEIMTAFGANLAPGTDFFLPRLAGRRLFLGDDQALLHGSCMVHNATNPSFRGIAYVRIIRSPLGLTFAGINIGANWPDNEETPGTYQIPTTYARLPDICTVRTRDFDTDTLTEPSREAVVLVWADSLGGPVVGWALHYEPPALQGASVRWDQAGTVTPDTDCASPAEYITYLAADAFDENMVRVVFTVHRQGLDTLESFTIRYNETSESWIPPLNAEIVFETQDQYLSGVDVAVDGNAASHVLLNAMSIASAGDVQDRIARTYYLRLRPPDSSGPGQDVIEGPIDLTRFGWREILTPGGPHGNWFYPPTLASDKNDALHMSWMQDHMLVPNFADGYRPLPLGVFASNERTFSIEYYDGLFFNTGF